jgi:hypothetical protein
MAETRLAVEPAKIAFHFADPDDGSILDVDVLAVPARRWRRRPESRDPDWQARRLGDLIVAARVVR